MNNIPTDRSYLRNQIDTEKFSENYALQTEESFDGYFIATRALPGVRIDFGDLETSIENNEKPEKFNRD